MENNMATSANCYGNNNGVNGQFGSPVPYQNPNQVRPVNCDEATNITSISDLQSYAAGIAVRFPDFAEGQPFVARVRRPSMLALAKQGKIPNALLGAASELFTKGGNALDGGSEQVLGEMYEITRILCEAALVQPSLADIESVGLALSDDQMMAIFSYTQVGISALKTFRKEQENT